MRASIKHLEKYNPCERDANDRRKKVATAVFSYFTANGHEYRKRYTAPPNTPENHFWNIAPKQITVNE